MKLTLTQEGDIQILTVKEEITPKDTKVLKAGVGKLFKNGKNKIILELGEDQTIPNEVLRELAALDILARELSGRIILAGISDDTKKKIELFATPPIIPCFASRAEAIATMTAAQAPTDAGKNDQKPQTMPTDGYDNDGNPTEPGRSPAAAAAIASGVDPALAAKISKLEEDNTKLRDQIRAMTILRREPPDQSTFKARIGELEKQLEEISAQVQAAVKK